MKNNDLDLLGQFARVEWMLHRYHQQNHRDHGPMGDTHRGQGRVLALLNLKPEVSQKELLSILDMRSQSLGELLAKLERSGYITRTPSQTDGRVMDIRLTQTGKEASGENEQQLDTETSFECLSEQEQSNLSDYLDRIIHALEQRFDASQLKSHFQHHPHFGDDGFGEHFPEEGCHPHFHGGYPDHGPDMNRRPSFDGRNPYQHHDMNHHEHFHDGDSSESPYQGNEPEHPIKSK